MAFDGHQSMTRHNNQLITCGRNGGGGIELDTQPGGGAREA